MAYEVFFLTGEKKDFCLINQKKKNLERIEARTSISGTFIFFISVI
jgi:hypothetical protein